MSRDAVAPRWVVGLWLLPALLLSAIPLPHWLATLWPDWLLLLLLAFAMHSPRSCGPITAFSAGLVLDAFRGILLGQHAFAFVVVAWRVHRFHLRIRMFPPLQQAGTVFSVLFNRLDI
jgi:rod shape-determining protein MreD